jgi:hypothetical protein
MSAAASTLPKLAVILAPVVGLVAIGTGVTLLGPTSSLTSQVDRIMARDRDDGPAGRNREPQWKAEELHDLTRDPRFGRLAGAKQDYVHQRLRELEAYLELEKQVSAASDPADARTDEQLQAIRTALARASIPEPFRDDWQATDMVQRLETWRSDADALAHAVAAVERRYRDLTLAGQQVLDNKEAADLPGRARAVLRQAEEAPQVARDRTRPIPGSERITYSTVFPFPEVAAAMKEWQPLRTRLEPLSTLSQP